MTLRFRPWMGNAALFVGATVFTLLVLEVALRLMGQRMVFPQMFVEDPHTVYRLKPNVRAHTIHAGYLDYQYTVNSQGFRSRADIGPKSPRSKRVLFVGDSFTFGVGVNDSATYPARVEARLRQWCGAPVESINAGVGGFGTSHELSFLQHSGWRLDPDVVVLGFLTSDPEDNSLQGLHRLVDGRLEEIPASERPGWGLIRAHRHVPGYTWLVEHSTLFNWARLKIGSLAAQRAAAREDATASSPSAQDGTADQREVERWRLTAAIFEQVRAQSDRHGARLLVAIIPHGGTLSEYYATGRSIAVDRMLDICRQQSLECVNVSESIRRAHPTSNPFAFYLREGHFNATGYDLVADAVAKRVGEALQCAIHNSENMRSARLDGRRIEVDAAAVRIPPA